MFDNESEFKYYKLDSCCIALIVFLFFIERFRLTMISDHDCTNSLLLHNKIPPTFAASNSKYFLIEFQKVGRPGVVLPGQRGSLWVSLESAVELLAGEGITEWLRETSASVPSSHGTAGGWSHFLATMWTLLHRATGLLTA